MTEILIQYNTNNHLLMDWKIPAPAADLILWHEGYKASTGPSSKLFNEAEWEKYTDSIINFANTNNYKTVGISIIFGDDGSTLPVNGIDWINRFIQKAEHTFKIGIDIGYESGADPVNDTKKFQSMAETLAKIKAKKPLTLGLNGEQKVVSKNALQFTHNFKTALKAANVNYDELVILSMMKPESGWQEVLLNGFEFYSQQAPPDNLNKLSTLTETSRVRPLKHSEILSNPAKPLRRPQTFLGL